MQHYAIGLGSNRTGGGGRRPEGQVRAAIERLGSLGHVVAVSPIIATAPLGPSDRRFANAAMLLASPLGPADLLGGLKAIERRAGRRAGRRWGARTLDLDILLWSGGRCSLRRPRLSVPHPRLAERRFVLVPLMAIVPGWRVPGGALRIRHLAARLTRQAPVHRSRGGAGL